MVISDSKDNDDNNDMKKENEDNLRMATIAIIIAFAVMHTTIITMIVY